MHMGIIFHVDCYELISKQMINSSKYFYIYYIYILISIISPNDLIPILNS